MPVMDGGWWAMVGMKQRKSEDEGKEEEYWMAPAILKWTRSGPWGGGMKASQLPAPKRNIGPPGSAAEQWTVSGWSVDNAMNASELRSRCPDFPAPSSWCGNAE